MQSACVSMELLDWVNYPIARHYMEHQNDKSSKLLVGWMDQISLTLRKDDKFKSWIRAKPVGCINWMLSSYERCLNVLKDWHPVAAECNVIIRPYLQFTQDASVEHKADRSHRLSKTMTKKSMRQFKPGAEWPRVPKAVECVVFWRVTRCTASSAAGQIVQTFTVKYHCNASAWTLLCSAVEQ